MHPTRFLPWKLLDIKATLRSVALREKFQEANMNGNHLRRKLTKWCRGLGACVLLLGAAAPALGAQTRPMSDQAVTDAVEDEMLVDMAVSLHQIDVDTEDGIVTLTGTVDHLLEKDRAARIARAVRGVRSVVNRLEVMPEQRSDLEIRRDIEMALLTDPATESFEVDPIVHDGRVRLSGEVDSWQESRLAKKVAMGVRGVVEVDNDLEVDVPSDRSDSEIEAEIEQALAWNIYIDDALIGVDVNDGKVVLTGTVGSAAEKSRAITEAWVAGVESVKANRLEVSSWARDESIRSHSMKIPRDAEIRAAVDRTMMQDPRVLSFDVDSEVDSGVVTLRGRVDNLKAKRAAGQNARNTWGVVRVVNRIKVRPGEQISDDAVESSIESAVVRDPYLESFEIDVDVHRGIATLEGMVDTWYEKARADDVASRTEGVIAVNNDLAVDEDVTILTYDPFVDDYDLYVYEWYAFEPGYTLDTDAEIHEEIHEELFWSPFVDADEVRVTVNDGVATLTGTVDTWAERRAATENAFEGGAMWVDNDLVVDLSGS